MAKRLSVFVVDDDASVRKAIKRSLETYDFQVEAFPSAIAFLETGHKPENSCLVLDIRMPGMSGLELQDKLHTQGISIPIIFITGHGDVPLAVRALKNGAADFIEKPFSDTALVEAIKYATKRTRELPAGGGDRELFLRFETLTRREHEVLEQLVVGQSNKCVAHILEISPRTVEVHRARIMEKMHARNLSHLVRLALSAGVKAEES